MLGKSCFRGKQPSTSFERFWEWCARIFAFSSKPQHVIGFEGIAVLSACVQVACLSLVCPISGLSSRGVHVFAVCMHAFRDMHDFVWCARTIPLRKR